MRVLFILLTFLLILVGCVVAPLPTTSPPASTTEAVSPADSGTHFLLRTSGQVQLFRQDWPGYYPVAFGVALLPTDLVKVENEASILCTGSELEVKTLAAGQHRVPCPRSAGILSYKGARFSIRTLGPVGSGEIPFALYPRNTLLLQDRPTLYWHDTGASSYTISLTHGGQPVWTVENVTGSSLPYPSDQPSLEQNQDYRLVVVDNDSQLTSRQDEPPGTGFRLATLEEKKVIEAQLERIQTAVGLTDDDRKFAQAIYYAGLEPSPTSGFRPVGEAWLALKDLAAKGDAPAVHLWYGEILTGLRLPEDVIENAYQTALTNAEILGDVESQAVAEVRLWCLTETASYVDEAIALHRQLNDQAEVERLEQGRDKWEITCK